MIDIHSVTVFLGWCSILNIAVLAFSFLFISVFKDITINVHAKLTGVNSNDLPKLYFHYIGTYKMVTLVFNIVPYFALKLMVS